MNKALFLDRDGVINDNTKFVNELRDLKFIPGIFDFACDAIDKGYKIFVITNQGGIAAGHLSVMQHSSIMNAVMRAFEMNGCPITEYYCCAHLPPDHKAIVEGSKAIQIQSLIKDCSCRKPKPGLILQAADQHDIDLSQSVMVGDMQTDIDAAKAAGVGQSFLFNPQEGIWPELTK